jgi:SAM-dependent methyltransferase
MAIKNHFEEKGSDYSKYRPTYPEELATSLASLCAAKEHVLEVGCGTGQLSGILATHFANVTATDPSLEQINNATPFDRVSYKQENAEQISLAENCVDLIVAAQAAHWFNLPEFYQQAKNVGKDHALIALISYGVLDIKGSLDTEKQMSERFKQFYWQEIHDHWPAERQHVENGYQSFDFPFEEIALPALSIQREWTTAELMDYIETWSATRLARKAGEGKIIETFQQDINALNPDKLATHKINWPIVGRLGYLHKSN